jgi:hypothetical protein
VDLSAARTPQRRAPKRDARPEGAARIGTTGKPFDESVHSGSIWTQ